MENLSDFEGLNFEYMNIPPWRTNIQESQDQSNIANEPMIFNENEDEDSVVN
jgi:hypothetical protein